MPEQAFGHNWSAVSHQAIWDALQPQAGDGFGGAGGRWQGLADRMIAVTDSVGRANATLHAAWDGDASVAAQKKIEPLRPWADQARELAAQVKNVNVEQGDRLTTVQNAVFDQGPPAAGSVMDAGINGFLDGSALVGTVAPVAPLAAPLAVPVGGADAVASMIRYQQAEQFAQEAMTNYQDASGGGMATLPQFAGPEGSAVQPGPGSPPSATGVGTLSRPDAVGAVPGGAGGVGAVPGGGGGAGAGGGGVAPGAVPAPGAGGAAAGGAGGAGGGGAAGGAAGVPAGPTTATGAPAVPTAPGTAGPAAPGGGVPPGAGPGGGGAGGGFVPPVGAVPGSAPGAATGAGRVPGTPGDAGAAGRAGGAGGAAGVPRLPGTAVGGGSAAAGRTGAGLGGGVGGGGGSSGGVGGAAGELGPAGRAGGAAGELGSRVGGGGAAGELGSRVGGGGAAGELGSRAGGGAAGELGSGARAGVGGGAAAETVAARAAGAAAAEGRGGAVPMIPPAGMVGGQGGDGQRRRPDYLSEDDPDAIAGVLPATAPPVIGE
ncbi:hypothetical protein EV188_102531 [Actinomycetospora succinea]|uniref:PPE family protein n=1 Tax=Actinomycetospora succinea TaxID=663603 RepID=A0A4R6VID5_9PSEU|nr:hypothetical protein [Actinomycetospora succinea]TDQ62874.1 hypothetical protein EV188_102531 [Actinomycetospora succinea]